MTLVPFNREFNRMTLRVRGAAAPEYRVAWMNEQTMLEEWHSYSASELAEGINLADDFQLNPFCVPLGRIDDLVLRKQTVESTETWRRWELEGKPAEKGLAECEARRQDLLSAIRGACMPVVHNIRIEASQ